jgi:hypothetical protein
MEKSEQVPQRVPRMRGAPLTPAMREADIWAETIIAEQLPRTRQLAQQWSATLTALTALFGAGIAIDADDAVRALHPEGWAIAYGALTLLALGAAAIAIALATRAGHGWLKPIPAGVAERLALRRQLTHEAQSQLEWSKRTAVAAVVLLTASFGVRWYAPQQRGTPTSSARGTVGYVTPSPKRAGASSLSTGTSLAYDTPAEGPWARVSLPSASHSRQTYLR